MDIFNNSIKVQIELRPEDDNTTAFAITSDPILTNMTLFSILVTALDDVAKRGLGLESREKVIKLFTERYTTMPEELPRKNT